MKDHDIQCTALEIQLLPSDRHPNVAGTQHSTIHNISTSRIVLDDVASTRTGSVVKDLVNYIFEVKTSITKIAQNHGIH